MGHGGQLSCLRCGYSLEVLFGVGFAQCGIFDAANWKDEEAFLCKLRDYIPNRAERNLVLELLRDKHGTPVSYGYGLYRCPKCGKFKNHFHYQIKHDGGMFEPEHECGKCAVNLEYLGDAPESEDGIEQIDVSGYPCPKCGARGLQLGGGIMWD